MLRGEFEEAWRVSDRIATRGTPDANRLWDGEPFAGKRVMIRCLHGFGDAIQFLRYGRMMRREAATVMAQTHPQLVSLLRGMPFLDAVLTWSDGPLRKGADWDQQVEVMELPRIFRTELATIPAEIPYLWVDQRYLDASALALQHDGRPRVGLLWEGGGWDRKRDVPLAELRPVLETTGVWWYSFQRGPGRDELAGAEFGGRVRDLSGDAAETVYFAADLMQIDLLITVDTMAAHLAGALGKPVWVLLAHDADWRWMLDRPDSPWYPTMRLFRQSAPGEWEEPVRRVSKELLKFVNG